MHAGNKSYFLLLTVGQQMLVEASDLRIETHCSQGCHIQRLPDTTSSSPDAALPSVFATIPIQRSHTYQSSYPLAVKSPQLREFSDKGSRQYRSDSRNTTQQLIFCTPSWIIFHHLTHIFINGSQFLFQPVDMGMDPPIHHLFPARDNWISSSGYHPSQL